MIGIGDGLESGSHEFLEVELAFSIEIISDSMSRSLSHQYYIIHIPLMYLKFFIVVEMA